MEEIEGIRLNKYLSGMGVCSRREADRMMAEGRIRIDGETVGPGARIFLGQQVELDGNVLQTKDAEPGRVLLLCNKPMGIVCTTDRREKDNIIDFIHYPERIYPIGRLDKDSHGLILLTNVGYLHNEITRAAGGHEKEYLVRVDRRITADFVRRMSSGVYLSELSCMTAPAKVKKLSERTFSIVLTQGKNRQIRRMCRECSYGVVDLERIRVMHFTLEGLSEGEFRAATEEEWKLLDAKIGRA
ncbi:MAG: pseudouridine synthase [Lachnospiraceae bacterium]|nr:pseudouridine synthase [Lachnospiraceae bacterium]